MPAISLRLWAVLLVPELFGFPAPVVAQARPDIVVFLTDDQPYHEQQFMPLTNGLLGELGVTFEQGLVHSALCAPSRATLYTGLYRHHHGVVKNSDADLARFDPSQTYAVWLHEAGYRTALYGKYLWSFSHDARLPVPPGWDDFRRIGAAPKVASAATAFINATPPGTPLLLHLAFTRPHAPAEPLPQDVGTFAGLPPWRPPSFDEADVSDKPQWIRKKQRLTAAQMDELITFHQKQVESLQGVDRAVRDVVAALAAAGRLENAVLFFISDNGLALGEHRIVKKKDCPYEECLRVPFLVRAPDALVRTDSQHAVSLVDVAPTIADYAGVVPPVPLDGVSLRPLVQDGSAVWPDATLHESGSGVHTIESAVRTAEWVYVEYQNGDRELYDMLTDPWQLDNRANDPAYADVQADLAVRLAEMKQ